MALAALDWVRATMDEIGEHAWIISIVGNFLTLFGAYWTARAVLLAPEQAAEIAVGRWDKEPLKNALLKQSSDARIGLVCVAVGSGFQIVSRRILFVSKLPRARVERRRRNEQRPGAARSWRWLRSTG